MRIKVLIVDDEILVRIGIKHSLDWEANGLEVIGEASEGKTCLEMTAKYNPDLIILDINMPEMDGIQVLKELKKQGFSGKVIMLTCYEEVEYVKEAMKNGAVDYVLKTSIEENGLLHAIKELSFELPKGSKQEDEKVKEALEERMVSHILDGYPSYGDIRTLHPHNLFCITCKIPYMEEIEERYRKKGMMLFYNSMDSIIRQTLVHFRENIFSRYKGNCIVIFISMSQVSGMQECVLQLRQFVQHLHTTMKEYLGITLIIGISEAKYDLKEMKAAYEETKKAISQKFVTPQKDIFYSSEIAHADVQCEEALQSAEELLRLAVSNKQYSTLHEELSHYFEAIRKMKVADVGKIKYFLCDIIKLVQSLEQNWKGEYEKRIHSKGSLEDVETLVYQFLSDYCADTETSENNYLIRRAEEYMKQNYMHNISLHSLAAYLELSESYTSRLFNQEKKMNIPAYMNELRIQQAKRLLKDSNMKIYEIAEAVGYASTTAFHITFKKMAAVTPIEYRNCNNN